MHFVSLLIKFLNHMNLKKNLLNISYKCIALLGDVYTSVTVMLGVPVHCVYCLTEKGFVWSIERWRKSGNPVIRNIKLQIQNSL